MQSSQSIQKEVLTNYLNVAGFDVKVTTTHFNGLPKDSVYLDKILNIIARLTNQFGDGIAKINFNGDVISYFNKNSHDNYVNNGLYELSDVYPFSCDFLFSTYTDLDSLSNSQISDCPLLADVFEILRCDEHSSKVTLETLHYFIASFKKQSDNLKLKLINVLKILAERDALEWMACLSLMLDLGILHENDRWNLRSWSMLADLQDISQLIDNLSRIDVNAKDCQGYTLLMSSIAKENTQLALRLLDISNIHARHGNLFALHIACLVENIEIVEALLAKGGIGVNDLKQCLVTAILNGRVDIVKKILATDQIEDLSQPIDGETPIKLAVDCGYVEIIRVLVANPSVRNKIDEKFIRHSISKKNALILKEIHSVFPIEKDLFVESLLNNPTLIASPLIGFLKSFFPNVYKNWNRDYPNSPLDLGLLFSEILTNPRLIASDYTTNLKDFFYEDYDRWIVDHPQLQIARLIYEEEMIKANEVFNSYLASSNVKLDFLIRTDIRPLIIKNSQAIIKWLSSQDFDSLSVTQLQILLGVLHPAYHQYLSSTGGLAPKGLNIITSYLSAKPEPSLPEESVSVCPDQLSFGAKLQELSENPHIKTGYSHYFYVADIEKHQPGVAWNFTTHFTPLYFHKLDDGWHIVITDSKGVNEHTDNLMATIDIAKKTLKNFDVSHCYLSTLKRQRAKVSAGCDTFCTIDLSYFYRHGVSFLNKLKDLNQYNQTKFNFTYLPPELMKTTQSISEINKYLLKYPDSSMERRKEKGRETLAANLERHSVKNEEGKLQNALVEQRLVKFHRMILKVLLDELSVGPSPS